MGQRPAGSARPYQQHVVQRRPRQAGAQAFGEAPEIGVVPEALAVPEHDRVHRADPAGGIGQVVQVRHHGLLVGKGHVQPGEALGLGPLEDLRQLARRASVGVEQLVPAGQALGRRLGLVHRGRAGELDAAPDETHPERAGHGRRIFCRRVGLHSLVVSPPRPRDKLFQPVQFVNPKCTNRTIWFLLQLPYRCGYGHDDRSRPARMDAGSRGGEGGYPDRRPVGVRGDGVLRRPGRYHRLAHPDLQADDLLLLRRQAGALYAGARGGLSQGPGGRSLARPRPPAPARGPGPACRLHLRSPQGEIPTSSAW